VTRCVLSKSVLLPFNACCSWLILPRIRSVLKRMSRIQGQSLQRTGSERWQLTELERIYSLSNHPPPPPSRYRPISVQNFNFLNLMNLFGHFGKTPWTGNQPDEMPLPTQDNTTQKNADTHPCLECDLNPRSQCSSGRRQHVPQTARPLGPASVSNLVGKYKCNWDKSSLHSPTIL
jgi:hypothetical protein